MTIIFSFLENVAEENLFYIVSPKDLVLAKVCFERFTNVVSFGYDCLASLPSSVTVVSPPTLP